MKLYYKFIIINILIKFLLSTSMTFLAHFGVKKIWVKNLIIFTLISARVFLFVCFSFIDYDLSYLWNEEHCTHIYEDYED